MERPVDRAASDSFTLNMSRMPRKQKKQCAIRKLMEEGFEWTTPSPRDLILPHQEFTWEDLHILVAAAEMVVVATVGTMLVTVEAAMAVLVVIAVDHLHEGLLRHTTEADVREGITVHDRDLIRHVFKIFTLQDFLG